MFTYPVLLAMSFFTRSATGTGGKKQITIPWFAFLLTMAMTALGAETSIDKFRQAGAKPFILAAILFIWLMGGGYLLARYLGPLL